MTAVDRLFGDLVVLEAASVLAGPAVGMFFAELGATVVKVENLTTRGDTTRRWKLPSEPEGADVSGYFSCVNWGKQSIGLNFALPEGRDVLLDLVRRSDIFLQSFKPGDERKFQLGYPALSALNDRLIYAHITAYGPDDDRTGFDAVLQAETGFTGMNGVSGGGPVKMPVALIDLLLAHQLKQALLLALMERLHTGKGSYTTVSLFQAGVASLANQATNYLVGHTVPGREGSDHPNIVPYGTVFRTADGHDVVLAVGTDPQFRALCEVLGIPEAADDERFRTNTARVAHREPVKRLIAECIARMRCARLLEALRTRRVPAGAVRGMDEVFGQPPAQALLLDGTLENGVSIRGVRTVAFETSVADTRRPLAPPPAFNQHGEVVLREMLGYTDDRIAGLRQRGVIP
jgi:crotonobetainyl-CoA:carnitine CoA-transferase CaiB-like acyl-CoA transferase